MRRLFDEIWGRTGNPPVTPELLRALTKAGNYVAARTTATSWSARCVGFLAARRHALHSHIAGVAPGLVGRSVGFALKLHQRAWALDRGVDMIAWTFDPLVAATRTSTSSSWARGRWSTCRTSTAR